MKAVPLKSIVGLFKAYEDYREFAQLIYSGLCPVFQEDKDAGYRTAADALARHGLEPHQFSRGDESYAQHAQAWEEWDKESIAEYRSSLQSLELSLQFSQRITGALSSIIRQGYVDGDKLWISDADYKQLHQMVHPEAGAVSIVEMVDFIYDAHLNAKSIFSRDGRDKFIEVAYKAAQLGYRFPGARGEQHSRDTLRDRYYDNMLFNYVDGKDGRPNNLVKSKHAMDEAGLNDADEILADNTHISLTGFKTSLVSSGLFSKQTIITPPKVPYPAESTPPAFLSALKRKFGERSVTKQHNNIITINGNHLDAVHDLLANVSLDETAVRIGATSSRMR